MFFNQGSIPSCIGNLTSLEELRLDFNRIAGTIPDSLGKTLIQSTASSDRPGALTRLEELWLHCNQLTGHIPSAIGKLTQLRRLNLYTNQLDGDPLFQKFCVIIRRHSFEYWRPPPPQASLPLR